VEEDEAVDAAVRLEVNHWNGSVEPRLVLRELFRRDGEPTAADATPDESWRERFEAELGADPAASPPELEADPKDEPRRRLVPSTNSPAAVLAELVSSGDSVLAVAADAPARAALEQPGLTLADYAELERKPGLARDFTHVVLVDPPALPLQQRLAERPPGPGAGYLHPVWGESEWRFALAVLGAQCARREEVATVFRSLRDAGEAGGDELCRALAGGGLVPRQPEVAARCFRVLAELGLLSGTLEAGDGTVGVVSSEGTDLERSATFRAYSARFKEGKRYLEGRKHP
jgi:hypothetical protein